MEGHKTMTIAEIKRGLPPVQDAVIAELRNGPRDQSDLVDIVSQKLNIVKQMVRYAILSLDIEVQENQDGQLLLVSE